MTIVAPAKRLDGPHLGVALNARLSFALVALLASLGFSASAHAGDTAVAGADDDDSLLSSPTSKPKEKVPDASAFNSGDDDDIQIAAPIKIEPPKPAPEAPKGPATHMPVDLNGKTALADNWAPTVVATDVDSVLLEVPVLYASNGTGFDGTAYWLVAEVYADGKKITESRTQVSKDSVSLKGPSVQFFKLFAPVATPAGVLEVRVSKLVGTSTKPSLLFVRTVSYTLGG